MGRVFFNTRKNIVDVAAAKVLIASDSGNVFNINQASAYEITLPLSTTIEKGWNATFVIGTADTNAVTIANNTAEDKIIGGVAGHDGSAATASESAVDEIVFISGAAVGDTCNVLYNGTNFLVTGIAGDAAHITVS
jgi:hypothetical protein